MLYERKDLPEIHQMKHIHDDHNNKFIKYSDVILEKSLSPHIFLNDNMNIWLIKLQKMVSLSFDQFNIVKNFKNYTVDKYEWRQK